VQPPNVIRFNASNLPVAQLTMSSDSLPEQQLFDYGLNFIRVRLFTIPGLSTPAPFGGKQRQINVDIDPRRLAARGLSPADVVNAHRGDRQRRRFMISCVSAVHSEPGPMPRVTSTYRFSNTCRRRLLWPYSDIQPASAGGGRCRR
jgi:hypothetical protein